MHTTTDHVGEYTVHKNRQLEYGRVNNNSVKFVSTLTGNGARHVYMHVPSVLRDSSPACMGSSPSISLY